MDLLFAIIYHRHKYFFILYPCAVASNKYILTQMAVMDMTDADKKKFGEDAPIVKEYQAVGELHDGSEQYADHKVNIEKFERFQFYEHAKTTYAIIHTG